MIEQYLKDKGIKYNVINRPSGFWAVTTCPNCGEDDFAISLISGAYKCIHLKKCGIQGSFRELKRLYGDIEIYSIPKNYNKVDVNKIKPLTVKHAQWLQSRGISEATIRKVQDHLGSSGDNICFVYKKNNEIVSVKYRNVKDKKFYREKNTRYTLYLLDIIPNEVEDLVIVEGEIDELSAIEYGIHAVSVPNGADNLNWIQEEFEALKRFKRIILMLDTDEAGQKHVEEIRRRLGRYRVVNVQLPRKDLNECLMDGVTLEEIAKCVINSSQGDSYIKSIIEYADMLNEHKEQHRTMIKELGTIIGGWRMGEVTVWTGTNGSGKTNYLLQEMKSIAEQNIPVLIGSFEMKPTTILRWYINMLGVSESEAKKELQKYADCLYMIDKTGSIKAEELYEIIQYGAKVYGIKHVVIDSLMRVLFRGSDKYAEEKNFVVRLSTIAKEENLHIHLVAHPRKAESDTDEPEKVDVAGSSDITNNADNVIVMYRVTEDMTKKQRAKLPKLCDNVLIVRKNREHGTMGRVPLLFDAKRKTFTEAI